MSARHLNESLMTQHFCESKVQYIAVSLPDNM